MGNVPRGLTGRRGLTLVELLVVIVIISILMTLVVLFIVPSFQDNKNVIRGVDRVTTTLLIAKQRAYRDDAPRGVRFLVDATTKQAQKLQFIEQPDPFSGGQVLAAENGTTVQMSNVDILGGASLGNVSQYPVQPGDYFRYQSGTPANFQIKAVAPNATGLGGTLTLFNKVELPGGVPTTDNYRIIRQPRPIAGEAEVDLPANVVVDVGQVPANFQVPIRSIPGVAGTVYYEILFDPAGGVTNRSSSTPIVLVVRDSTSQQPLESNTTTVMGINPRTGFISAHPVGPASNPLQYALDGKSSGM
jgi:prepilin-type N-terminal cleavage/methylation domain-containing protein